MIAKKCTAEDLHLALKIANERYQNNLAFKTLETKGTRVSFTLRVHDSKGPGSARSFSGRKTGAACWHAHGHLFEALFSVTPDAIVTSSRTTAPITREGGNWTDFQIGSMMNPVMASQACECNASAQSGIDRLNQSPLVFRTLSRAQIMRCPLSIFDPDHYLADGSCLCFDPAHQEMILADRVARRAKTLNLGDK